MKYFFLNQNTSFVIKIFSFYHAYIIIFTLLFVFLIINNKEIFYNFDNKKKKILRLIMAIVLLLNFILRRGSFIYYGVFNWRYHLDINFCNFTAILFFIYSITGSSKVYRLCYYMAFIGPLIAIIFPSMNLSIINYSFYSFIILHHFIFLFNIMFMFVEKIKYNFHDFMIVCFFLLVYIFTTYLFNLVFNTKYNMPLSFLNVFIKESLIIKFLLRYNYSEYVIMVIIIILLLIFARFFLKKLNANL